MSWPSSSAGWPPEPWPDLSIIPNILQIVRLTVARSAEKGSLLFQHRCNNTYRRTFRPDTISDSTTEIHPTQSTRRDPPSVPTEYDTRLCSVVFQNLSKYITFLLGEPDSSRWRGKWLNKRHIDTKDWGNLSYPKNTFQGWINQNYWPFVQLQIPSEMCSLSLSVVEQNIIFHGVWPWQNNKFSYRIAQIPSPQ